jgi:hypothetical protein
LRRYLLGLALVAATGQAAYDLRQGCLLVRKEGSNVDSRKVLPSGTREDFPWDLGAAFEYAQATAKDFGQWADDPREQEAQFQTEKVVAALRADGKDDAAKESEKKAKATARATGKRPKDPVTSSTSTEAPDIS